MKKRKILTPQEKAERDASKKIRLQEARERRLYELSGYKNFFESLNPRQQNFLLKILDYEYRKSGTVSEFLEMEYKINSGCYPYDDRSSFEILKFSKT